MNNARIKVKASLYHLFYLSLLALLLGGCGPSADSRYDSGYSDGYAAGYNTTCKIRATLIEGDWKDENYSKGYNAGYAVGSADCMAKKRD